MHGSFLDTNVLLYIASEDRSKADRAEELMREGGTISVQVLNETTNIARRKMRLSWADTNMFLSMVGGLLKVCPLTVDTHETGLAVAKRYGFSTWDAMVVAAALHSNCDTIWSEDMHAGLLLDGRLRIVNPFQRAG